MTIHSSSDHVPKCLQIDMNSNIHRGTTKLKRRDIDTIPKIHSICSAFLCSLITIYNMTSKNKHFSAPSLPHPKYILLPHPIHSIAISAFSWLSPGDRSAIDCQCQTIVVWMLMAIIHIIVISRLDRQAAGTANNYNLVPSFNRNI